VKWKEITMSRDKQTEIQQFVIDLQNASQKASKIITDETANYVKQNHKYNNLVDYAKAHIKSRFEYEAEFLTELGYAKDSEVAREIFEEIKQPLLDYFDSKDKEYSTKKIKSAKQLQIETAYYQGATNAVVFVFKLLDELKKKYTESEKDDG
jgi:hemerythrin